MKRIKPITLSASHLRRKLFIYSAIMFLVLTLSTAMSIILPIYGRLKAAEDNNLYHAVETRAMAINEWARRAKDLALQITSRTRIRQELEKYNNKKITIDQLRSFTEPKLIDAMNLSQEIIGIIRLDINGQEVATCGVTLPSAKRSVEAFEKNDISMSAPITTQDHLVIIVKAPIQNRLKKFVGTDLVIIDLCVLKTIGSNYTGLRNKSEIILGYSHKNQIFSVFPLRTKNQQDIKDKTIANSLYVFSQKAIKGKKGLGQIDNAIIAYHPIQSCNWGLLVVQDKKELYADLNSKLIKLCLLSILIYFFALFGFWFLMRPLADRLLIHTDELNAKIQEKTGHLEKEIAARQTSEQFLDAVFNSIQDGISVLDPELNVVSTNKAMQQLYKHALPFEGKKCFEVYHGHTERCDPCPVNRCFQTKKLEMNHVPLRRPGLPDGTLELYAFPMVNEKGIPTGIVEYTRDISQRIEDEKAKETLLREIHHRVKNNMQVISSLLSLQAAKLSDPKAIKTFAEAENRVHSMSLVHEILYQSDTITTIDFQVYLKNLMAHIANMFALQNIKLEIMAENITLSMEQAVPCGLIMTELITNAMKHAFPNAASGVIKIQAGYLKKDCMEMKISDNGTGFPKGFEWQKSGTLGLRLVRELVHGQLEGNLTLEQYNGICWVIHWQRK